MATKLPLQDRVAIVTGSSCGIGREIALHLASHGARLVINYISNSNLADLVTAEINANQATPRAITVHADVSNPTGVKSLFDSAEEAFNSPVHILVNSVGVNDGELQALANTTVENFDPIMNVNTNESFLFGREAVNWIMRCGRGRIIFLTTSLIVALMSGTSVYTTSKAAVEAMTKIMAKELKGTGFTANCVASGPIAMDMFSAGKTCDEERIGIMDETKDITPVFGFLATDLLDG